MKLHTKITACRVASYAALAAACASLAAGLSVLETLLFAGVLDWQDPVHTGLPYFWPILLCSLLALGLFKLYDVLSLKVQALERRAEFLAAQRRYEEKRRRA